MEALEDHLKRARGSMDILLNMERTPDTRMELLELTRARRATPMQGEESLIWPIQDGDDIDSRQELPSWISKKLGERVLAWVDQRNKWEAKIQGKAKHGKKLTAAERRNYEAGLHERAGMSRLLV